MLSYWIDTAIDWIDGQKRSRSLRSLRHQLDAVNRLEPEVTSLSDDGLRQHFRACAPPQSVRADEGREDSFMFDPVLLHKAFACVREAARRSLGMRPYDVQILAGLVMAQGRLAEMATGEGKTLVAALPASVLALHGRGVHVATVNAYLAERDHRLMRPIYEFLGLSSALLPEKAGPEEKRKAYEADITYGTGYEFGFDYLRDQLLLIGFEEPTLGTAYRRTLLGWGSLNHPDPVQRPFAAAVVDEVDSVLVDEAVTPLIISKPVPEGESPEAFIYRMADRAASSLEEGIHYEVEDDRRIDWQQEGLRLLYDQRPDTGSLTMRRAWHEYVEQALIATLFFNKDEHYLVRDDAIEIIDENTGRAFADRKWRGGLHQAVEAKEGVIITSESDSDVSVSRQRFYKLYPHLSGMTGTASEESEEFASTYGLQVIPIPRNKPNRRIDLPDRIFADDAGRIRAVVAEILAMRTAGRPVLIGTRTVRRSEEIASALQRVGIHCALLNARQDKEEAGLIALAGQAGRVTIATNMAGRGADIPLGDGVSALGGLHVIGIERNSSRRVDRQLIGRAGRQGDPGSSQFFLSREDDLLSEEEAARLRGEGEIRDAGAAAVFAFAQRKREEEDAAKRRGVMRRDQWLDKLKRHT